MITEKIYRFGWYFVKAYYNLFHWDPEEPKINIGSGRWIRKGWKNLDYCNPEGNKQYRCIYQQGADYNHNLSSFNRLPFDDDSIKLLYSSHCLEHIHKKYLRDLFSEFYRILKPGGAIRILLPERTRSKGTGQELFSPNSINPHDHKTQWTFKILQLYLRQAGFDNVKESWCFGSDIPEFQARYKLYNDGFDLIHPKESLYVDAIK